MHSSGYAERVFLLIYAFERSVIHIEPHFVIPYPLSAEDAGEAGLNVAGRGRQPQGCPHYRFFQDCLLLSEAVAVAAKAGKQ